MSTRLYDYILTVTSASAFRNGNTVIGLSSGTVGYIANVDTTTNNIKVKVNNVFQEFTSGETIVSNHYPTANVVSVMLYPNMADVSVYTLNSATKPSPNGVYYTTWGSGYTKPPTSELSVYVNGVYQHPEHWVYDSTAGTVTFRSFAKPGYLADVRFRRETGNVYSQSFAASNLSIGNVVTSASTSITKVSNSPFIRSKNAFTQPPIVRMLTFYYPGEWYPPNDKGNPSGEGAGYAWPANMPWRVAEVVGDYFSDIEYNVTFGSDSYLAYPMEVDGIGTSSDGTIDRVTMRVSNFDNVISNFVENPYLVGNVTSSSTTGYVNGEVVKNLDPATVIGNPSYNQTIVDGYYSTANSTWSYERAIAAGQTWKPLKYDTRDFLGGVVEIKSTLASHLKYWPEYSKLAYIDSVDANVIQVYNSAPYRVGDIITTPTASTTPTIVSVLDENFLLLSTALVGASLPQPLYIKNPEYDPDAYIKDVFKVTELSALNESFAEFTLTSWLQYFKLQLPKRKYYKNTCQWEYRGPECQYPGPAGGSIPGSIPPLTANSNPMNTNNQICAAADDECAKSYVACKLRNNTIHFGAFPGTGRQVPKQ